MKWSYEAVVKRKLYTRDFFVSFIFSVSLWLNKPQNRKGNGERRDAIAL
jgi:hypothetical protein